MHGQQTLPPVDMNRIHPANRNIPNIKLRDAIKVSLFLFTDMLCLCEAKHCSVRASQMFSYLTLRAQSYKTARNVDFRF